MIDGSEQCVGCGQAGEIMGNIEMSDFLFPALKPMRPGQFP